MFNTFARMDPRGANGRRGPARDRRNRLCHGLFQRDAARRFDIDFKSRFNPHAAGKSQRRTTDPSNRDNYLMVRPYFALSYNNSKGTPNWVSWQVTTADLGNAPRKQTFDSDASLPFGFTVVTQRDYDRSGFDRGHMCPHSDRAANQDMSFATFVMTNIIPQAPNVNRQCVGTIGELLPGTGIAEHDHLYITSGPAGQGGAGEQGIGAEPRGGEGDGAGGVLENHCRRAGRRRR